MSRYRRQEFYSTRRKRLFCLKSCSLLGEVMFAKGSIFATEAARHAPGGFRNELLWPCLEVGAVLCVVDFDVILAYCEAE